MSDRQTNRQIVNSDDVLDVEVKNTQGDKLGKIAALMIDKLDGQVAYVVLSHGGFLGMGDKLFALPWSMFTYNTTQECFTIPVDKETLKNSPGFDKDHWPDMSNDAWGSSIHQYYGIKADHRAHH